MLAIFPQSEPRPNSLIPESEKDMDYHRKFGRYAITSSFNYLHYEFLEKCRINRRFYKGEQWVFDDDLETFLKDQPGNERNRLKLVKNVIRPMVEYYRGKASRTTINYKAKSISSKAVNRREQKLAEMQFYTDMANDSAFGDVLRDKLPIGRDNRETEQFFSELYDDNYEQAINWLIEFIEHYNKFDQKKILVALDLALNGIGVLKDLEFAGHQVFKHLPSDNFFFDRTCLEQDLSDSAFMGDVFYLTPEDIFEQYDVQNEGIRSAIMTFAQAWSTYLQNGQISEDRFYAIQGRIPVYTAYWKDTQKFELAYVNDKFGYPYFTRINYTYPGEEKPRYTDKDIVEVKGEVAERLLKGKKKTSRYLETLRYSVIIPQEVFGYADA
jgi:predicted RNA-binding protein with PIN domain